MCPDLTSKPALTREVNDDLVLPTTAMRDQLAKAIKASNASTDTQLSVALEKKSRTLTQSEPGAVVELATFGTLFGDAAEPRILGAIKDMMPTASSPKDPSAVQQAIGLMQNKDHFKFTSDSVKNKVKTVAQWLERLMGDLPPQMSVARDCSSMKDIADRMFFSAREA